MACDVGVIAYIGVVEVGDAFLVASRRGVSIERCDLGSHDENRLPQMAKERSR